MTEKEFLKRFRKHVEIFLKDKRFDKDKMIKKIDKQICPFILDISYGIYRNKIVGLLNSNIKFQESSSAFFSYFHLDESIRKKMIAIVKSVRVREKK